MLSALYSARKRNDEGFTLIELLVVIIIIGVLAAIALPIFIDQQKQAVDASVKSDVRNTVENVQNWRVDHREVSAATTGDYTSAANGGKVAKSRANTVVGVIAKADGSYNVCAFNDGGSKYKQAESAWAFDSATGKFGLTLNGRCEGAVDADGNDVSLTPVAPKVETAALADATQDTDYTALKLAASGTPAPAISVSGLPAGLTYSAATQSITGEPTTSGTFNVTVAAKNFKGTATKTLALKVISKDAAPTFAAGNFTTAPTAVRGIQYVGYDASASGYPAPTYTVDAGLLPSGLVLDKNTGAISGTPDSTATSSTAVIKATNRSGSKTLAVTIAVQYAPSIDSTPLPAGFTDSTYAKVIKVSANPTPTTTVTASNLPAGVTAKVNATDGSVNVSGTPTVAGSWSLSLRSSNGIGSPDTKTFTFTTASSTVYSENFESYAATAGQYGGGTVPSGWSMTGGSCYGGRGVASPSSNSGYGTTNYLFFGYCSEGALNVTSPIITLTPGTYTFSTVISGVYTPAIRSTSMTIVNTANNATLTSVAGSTYAYDSTPRNVNLTVTQNTTVRLRYEVFGIGYTAGSTYGIVVDNVSVKRVS